MEGMASGASSLDSAGSSDGALNVERDTGGCDSVGNPIGGPECRSDYDDLHAQYQLLRHKHSDTVRRCEHLMKELEYYRSQHIAAMSQSESSAVQESAALRGKYSELVGDKQRLASEVQALQKELAEMRCHQQHQTSAVSVDSDGPPEHHYSSMRQYEALKGEYDSLRKRYDDIIATHTSTVNTLELAQEEIARLKKKYEEVVQERNSAVRERNGLKQQCTAAIRQWDIALRERNEYREELAKVSLQHEDAVKQINQAMVGRMKANKDIKRLTEERNAALHEYSLIMGERDTVHQEMESLGNELSQAYAKSTMLETESKQLADEKKALSYQIETLRREISSALHDRDEALKECNELRQRFGEAYGSEASSRERKNRLELLHGVPGYPGCTERDPASKELLDPEKESNARDYNAKRDKQRMDNLDQANLELDKLRKFVDTLQSDLEEAVQEAEVSKRRRDWAFSERDKIVLERESIRTLCDRLRKERDRAVSDLANALRDSDDIKKQRNEASKELKDLREKLESGEPGLRNQLQQQQQQPGASQFGQSVDSESEWDAVTVHLDLARIGGGSESSSERELGLMLVGGRDNPCYPDDQGVYVAQVVPGSLIDNKLRVNDCILRVNNLDCSAVSARVIMDALRSCGPGPATLTIRRRRLGGRRSLRTTQLPLGSLPHGITLEMGVYIAKISPGSLAAKDGFLAVGDRVLNINSKPMDGVSSVHEAMSILNDTSSSDVLTITTLKGISLESASAEAMPIDAGFASEKQKMVNSCSQTEQERLKTTSTPPQQPEEYERRYVPATTANFGERSAYKVSKSMSGGGGDKSSGISNAWDNFREKIDAVRGRRHSKERDEKKKRHRNSSPNTFEQEQDAIAKLDSVIESYHKKAANGSNGVLKRSKRRGIAAAAAAGMTIGPSGSGVSNVTEKSSDKNGGTWPKARMGPLIQNGTGTILHPRKTKERLPLSVLLSSPPKYDPSYGYNRISNPVPLGAVVPVNVGVIGSTMSSSSASSNRHTVYKALESGGPSSFVPGGSKPLPLALHSHKSFVPAQFGPTAHKDQQHMEHPKPATSPPVGPLDYSRHGTDYYHQQPHHQMHLQQQHLVDKSKRSSKYEPVAEALAHSRAHSQLYGTVHHQQQQPPRPSIYSSPSSSSSSSYPVAFAGGTRYPSPPSLPSAQSGESIGLPDARSFCFEPPSYSPQPLQGFGPPPSHHHHQHHQHLMHSHAASVELQQHHGYHHKPRAHPTMSSYDVPPYVMAASPGASSSGPSAATAGYEGGTFPRKKESQRFRIPSNPSVTSKSSIGKLSSGSIERTSERGSPMPSFHVEILSPGSGGGGSSSGTVGKSSQANASKRASVPDYCCAQPRPSHGQIRRIHIDKSQEPLGIQISCLESGGVFVSSVTEHSLASQIGLQIGDQLLDVCGINMRTCDSYQVAANILRQCGNSFTMLVQYSPDKYSELEGSESESESEEGEGEDGGDADGGGGGVGPAEKDASHSGSSTPCNSPEAPRKSAIEPLESSEPERDQNSLVPTLRAPKDRDRDIRTSTSVEVRSMQEREREIRNSASLDINIRKPELRASVTIDGIRNSLSGTGTLTRAQINQVASTLQRQNATVRSPTQEEQKRNSLMLGGSVKVSGGPPPLSEPRYLFIETRKCSNLGISLVGGNGVGIFVHSVQPGCLAEEAGLHTGDRILEYNGVDLKQATAEQAALELARPADKVTLIAQYMPERYNEVKDKPGDSFYVKAMFDRVADLTDSLQLKFNKDDVLYVDNTMFNGTPGHWRAWLVDQTGRRQTCGIIPSKFKVEEELLLRRSLGDLESDAGRRGTTSARRSFFRRKKHQRSSSRDSKELSQLTGVNMGWYSDSGTLNEENLPLSYQRVERLDYPALRPIVIVGPLSECVATKLLQEFPGQFTKCLPEAMHCSQATLEQGLRDSLYVDYRKKGSYFECTTVQAVKEICEKNSHCILDISLASLERLFRHQIYPIVLLIKFKSTKQIKEVKDSRYPSDKVSAKAAKEMYEHALKIESEYRQFINVVIPAGVNIAYICTQVKASVDEEQSKALWVPRGLP